MLNNVTLNSTNTESLTPAQQTLRPSSDDTMHDHAIFFMTLNSVISVAAIIMNTFTLMLFNFKKFLARTAVNQVLLSLAICDFCSGLLVTLHIIGESHMFPKSGDACNSCIAFLILVDVLTTSLTISTMLHLTGVTIDRYISLFYALKYRKIVTGSRVRRYIVFIWVLSFVASFMQIMWLYKAMDGIDDAEVIALQQYEAWYSVGALFQFMVIPMLLLGWLLGRMMVEIRTLLWRTPTLVVSQQKVLKQQHQACVLFTIMYLSFALLSMPYFILRLIHDTNVWRSENTQLRIGPVVAQICYSVKMSTALTNPLLYTICNSEIRRVAGKMLSSIRVSLTRCLSSRKFNSRRLNSESSETKLFRHAVV